MHKKDILIFLSDQHSGFCSGYAGDKVVRTPNLDRIAAAGTVFDAAYTSCPLCIPARMSMLSGQLPSKTGVLNNYGSIPSDQATFLHSLGAEGYETVLCGRMHFEGPDQRHGFTKRISGDCTPLYAGDRGADKAKKQFNMTSSEFGCLRLIGAGNSPTLEYDRYVIRAALEYLQQDHDKPQCIVIGTYAPHFPYVAPVDLYEYYLDKVEYAQTLSKGCNYEHPIESWKIRDTSKDTVIRARAAYWGMVEFLDRNIGSVYEAWDSYLKRNNRDGVFVYLSDHGDQVGERGLYGKKTFFESSSHIPLVFQGSGIAAGKRIQSPCSIMDIGPTLCEMTGACQPPEQDGRSLLNQISNGIEGEDRYIISEFIELDDNLAMVPGRMIRKGNWKYITYSGLEAHDLLFDLSMDPYELNNVLAHYSEKAGELRDLATHDWDPEDIIRSQKIRKQHDQILRRWVKHADPDRSERWKTTEGAIKDLEISHAGNTVIPEHLQKMLKMFA